MKALCWAGTHKVQIENVPNPKILNPRDAIIKITSTAIWGSDLHLFHGYVPGVQVGEILAREFMGEIVEIGSEVRNVKVGDRVVVRFPMS